MLTLIPVLLESPFAGEVAENRKYLQRCIRDCFERGEAPFASHQMYTDALDDTVSFERDQGIAAGLLWGAFAQRTVVYSDRGISRGMEYGIATALRVGRPVEYRQLDKHPTPGSSQRAR